LRQARAYAYGGSIIQDLGYYPFGSRFYSDLVHCVRSGDFVEALVNESQDMNELAFALGALAHYASDLTGHYMATNRSVPILYPELRKKFGDVVTFDEKPSAHIKVEFGYDVVQVARGKYAPEAYHEFIGFEVFKELLERAFRKTYGLEVKDIFISTDLTIGTYRHTISSIIPDLTKTAWELKKDEIQKLVPEASLKSFHFQLIPGEYEKKWGTDYKKPGIFARIVTFFVKILPKIGPLKVLAFKPPTPETEQLFLASFDATLIRYRQFLRQIKNGNLQLIDKDLDTGSVTKPGEYPLADKTYGKLLMKLQEHHFKEVSSALREDILTFYKNAESVAGKEKERVKFTQAIHNLTELTEGSNHVSDRK
jgi:hypothetical protein